MYKVLDLFSGAGGMSKGFESTGKYEIKVAVEKHPYAKKTYEKNHKSTIMLDDILNINDYHLFKEEYGSFDIIIGGPPCQGFSNANRQKNNLINMNNSLVKKYIEVIENLQPVAFVMENVRMIKSKTHKFYLSKNDDLSNLNLIINNEDLCLFEGVSPLNGIERILTDESLIKEMLLPEHFISNLKQIANKSYTIEKREAIIMKKRNTCFKDIKVIMEGEKYTISEYNDYVITSLKLYLSVLNGEKEYEEIKQGLYSFLEFQQMLKSAQELLANEIYIANIEVRPLGVYVGVKTYTVIDYFKEKLGRYYEIDDQILNAAWFGTPQSRERYIAIGVKKTNLVEDFTKNFLPKQTFFPENYRTVWDAIQDLEEIIPGYNITDGPIDIKNCSYKKTDLNNELRNSSILYNHTVTETRVDALKRFEALRQGENFHNLDKSLIENTYSQPSRTQNSIYSRLEYFKPSGTVTNVRKSMWIHPTINRAVSIREAARLQTFPDDFVFIGTKDSQYQQIGNAVPPLMAKAIALELINVIENQTNQERNHKEKILH